MQNTRPRKKEAHLEKNDSKERAGKKMKGAKI